MTAEDNAAVVRRLIDQCVNTHRADLLGELVSPDVRVHPATPGTGPATDGLARLRESFAGFRTVFPDLHVTVEDVVASGDRVAVRWTATGTHTGELAGVPGTGRAVRWGGIDLYRLTDGRIVEWWRNDDHAGLLAQLRSSPGA